jgi:5-methyltetrahydrofolate--homocysteine methyltransferase
LSLTQLTEAIMHGDLMQAQDLTWDLLESGTPPTKILDALTDGMDDVGRRFKAAEIFVPEVLISSRAMKQAMNLLEPYLVEAGYEPICNVVIGTVAGDMHDIGKNLVTMMWKGANVNVVDLGTNVMPEQFVAAAQEHDAKIVGISALLTTTMVNMPDVIQAVRDADLTDTKVVIGGAPITQDFADEINADGYAPDAASAVDLIKGMVHA